MNGTDTLDIGPDTAQPKLKGVFSSAALPGQEPDPAVAKHFWFARESVPGVVTIQLLDEHQLPTQRKIQVPKDEFLRDFTLEPDLGYRLLTQRVLMGDYYRNQGMNVEAKIEYQKVLRVDEENIRGNFGLGLAYLALNQLEKGRYAFEKLVRLDESFSAEHKHLFNDFGIALRKRGLFDEALAFYHRARELCDDDEHLRLNIARAWFEKGDTEMAFTELRICLELDPNFREVLAFLAYLQKHEILPQKPELREYFQRMALKRSEFGSLLED
ncbi:tetratricopeptide repeat protein [Fundidesulfovibrio soli]|uniref:tetratricopeptide repeat protein n=1 Tax=Fundidesulfovibrio soli TaxID=2922716 RepID=UPI001FAF7DEE|nr:tetratricopeptide repeat protein [Fundidesulfovibrio soli]